MDYIKWAEEYEQEASRLKDLVCRLKEERKHTRSPERRSELDSRIDHYYHLARQMQSTAAYLRRRGTDENTT